MQPTEIKTIHTSDWWSRDQLDELHTRLRIGQSSEGFHYAVEESLLVPGRGSYTWSKPFKSKEEAERVAGMVENGIPKAQDRYEKDREPPQTTRAEAADMLSSAGEYRRRSMSADGKIRNESVFRIAKDELEYARNSRESIPFGKDGYGKVAGKVASITSDKSLTYESPKEPYERYWSRENTVFGRVINDVLDAGRRLLGRTPPRQEFEESLLIQKDQLRSEARDIGLPVHEIQPVFHTGTRIIQGGDLQTSLFIGKSDDGYHYAVEGYQAGDMASTSPGWSGPLKTYEEARELGSAAQIAWENQRAIVLDSVADLNKEGHLQALGPMPGQDKDPQILDAPTLDPIEVEQTRNHALGADPEVSLEQVPYNPDLYPCAPGNNHDQAYWLAMEAAREMDLHRPTHNDWLERQADLQNDATGRGWEIEGR